MLYIHTLKYTYIHTYILHTYIHTYIHTSTYIHYFAHAQKDQLIKKLIENYIDPKQYEGIMRLVTVQIRNEQFLNSSSLVLTSMRNVRPQSL